MHQKSYWLQYQILLMNNLKNNVIVAIDGYSSCGKSTIAKAIAKRLGFIYIDTGAMYRAVTLFFIRNAININNIGAVTAALQNLELNFNFSDNDSNIILNGEQVSKEIRLMPVSKHVSEISAIKLVRTEMVRQQQRMGQSKNIVMDGRDIGTVVFPNAQVKIFMTANPKIRAERRYKELFNNGDYTASFESIFENIVHRDYLDTTRLVSPLKCADDAVVLDNTNITHDEQLEFVLKNIIPHLR